MYKDGTPPYTLVAADVQPSGGASLLRGRSELKGARRSRCAVLTSASRRLERADKLPVRKARMLFGDASEELHGFYTEGETFTILALVHVEPCELAHAVEAVADGMAVGEEIASCPYRRCVVIEVGGEGLDEIRAVAGVVEDYRLEGLRVEGLELIGVLLQNPEKELVGARTVEGRGRGGTVDAVPDLEGHFSLGVCVWKQGGVLFVAPDPDRDREVGQQALDVALHVSCQPLRQPGQLLWRLVFGRAQKEYDVV